MNKLIDRLTRSCVPLILGLLLPLLAACGGGGSDAGPASTTVLAGDPAQPAFTALQDKRSARVDKSDIVQGHLLTRLFVVFKADATVAQVNAAAQVAGASEIAASTTKLLMLTLQVPRQVSIGEMHALAERVRAQPGVFFAGPAREFKASVLPEFAPGAPVSPLDLSHLLATRFPQAWNARGAAAADCLPLSVPVYVWDKFGDAGSRPTFFSQIDSKGFVFDAVGANADVSGHGFDVVSTLGAAFDAQKPTGANPFRDCLVVHQIDAFGRDMFEATLRTLTALRGVTDNRLILNASLNFADTFCGPKGDQLCDAATVRTTPIEVLRGEIFVRAVLASAWASQIGATNLGERMLVTQAAGNVDPVPGGFLARSYRGFRSASFSSPAALATHVGQLSTLLRDASLWRSETDLTLPDITFPIATVTELVNLLVQAGASTSLTADNLLIVDSATDAEAFTDVRSSDFNFLGADVRAVGENVKLFDFPLVTGTSFAAPQVAGLASYLWVVSERLRNLHPIFTVGLIKSTSRISANNPTVPLIDAYAALQQLDMLSAAFLDPGRLIRKALVDVNGDGAFDHLDLVQYEQAYRLTDPNRPSIPSARDHSRFDLNGDGFSGGILIGQFDLEDAATSVTLPIEGFDITMNEAALSDIQILCFYAYSDLYASSPVNRAEALLERTRILGANHCVGARINALLPAQISTSASLDVTVELPSANGQFAPAPNTLVDFTPTCATVNPASGRTNANGVIATTVTPNPGCSSIAVDIVARATAGAAPLAQTSVNAVTARTLVGTLTITGHRDVSLIPPSSTFIREVADASLSASVALRTEIAADGRQVVSRGLPLPAVSGTVSATDVNIRPCGIETNSFDGGRVMQAETFSENSVTHAISVRLHVSGIDNRSSSCPGIAPSSLARSGIGIYGISFTLTGTVIRSQDGRSIVAIDFGRTTVDTVEPPNSGGDTVTTAGRLEPAP